jgi:hypothetical protein
MSDIKEGTMGRKNTSESGAIILETSIVIPIFMFLILGIYGLFVISAAQSRITHALIQSAQSLSQDAYGNEKFDSEEKKEFMFDSDMSTVITELIRRGHDPYFTSESDWYKDIYAKGEKHDAEVVSRNNTVRKRFIGYLAGDEDGAEKLLKSVGVVDGLNGIKISSAVSGGDLTVNVEYNLQLWFDFFDVGKIPVKQSYTSKMWNGKASGSSKSNSDEGIMQGQGG